MKCSMCGHENAERITKCENCGGDVGITNVEEEKISKRKPINIFGKIIIGLIIAVVLLNAFWIIRDAVQKRALSKEAQSALTLIHSEFEKNRSQGMEDWDAFIKADKLTKADPDVKKNWMFILLGNPPCIISAMSKEEFPFGPDKNIWYDLKEKKMHGFGVDKQEYPDPSIPLTKF